MNKSQAREYFQALSLLKLENNHSLLQDDMFYQKVMRQIISCINRLEKFKLIQNNNGYPSIAKQQYRQKNEDICYQIVNLMKSYAYFYHFIPFVHLDGFGKNQLYKYSGLKLLIKSGYLKNFIQKYPKESLEAGIDKVLCEQLDCAIADFDKELNSTQNYRDDIKCATQIIRNELNAYHQLLNKVLNPYMESKYKMNKPEVYADFKQTIKMSKIPRRKRALQGRITDPEGRPLHRVRVSVDGKKAVVKRGTKGNYFFRNLTNTVHELSFSCDTYNVETRKIVIYQGRTTILDIILYPIETEELPDIQESYISDGFIKR